MRACAVICEYNPFHRGHAFQLFRARELSGADGVISVMSGNFVQRGEPSIVEKHIRAEAAIRGGADLVLELPVPWALSGAEGFALGGISLAAATGVCTCFSYGSESGDGETVRNIARLLSTEQAEGTLCAGLRGGASYGAARQKAAETVLGEKAAFLQNPNDMLAVEYERANLSLGAPLAGIAVKREEGFHDGEVCSASAVRKAIQAGKSMPDFVPEYAASLYEEEFAQGRGPVFLQDMEPMILSVLRRMGEEEFSQLPAAGDGLSDRLKKASAAPELETLFAQVKTKRYSMSRLRRCVMHAFLGLTAQELTGMPPYIRVLAMNETGQKLLAEMRKKAALPILTKPAAIRSESTHAQHIFRLEARADDLYALCMKQSADRCGGNEYRRCPVRILKGETI